MEKKQWIQFLEVFTEYNPNLGFTNDVLDKLQSGQLNGISTKQEEVIMRLYNKSYHKSKIDAKIKERKEVNEYTKAMNQKMKETYSTSVEDISRPVPIGFKVPKNKVDIFEPNRFTLNNMKKQSSPKNWDDDQWNSWWND